jgi:hypothetical protein
MANNICFLVLLLAVLLLPTVELLLDLLNYFCYNISLFSNLPLQYLDILQLITIQLVIFLINIFSNIIDLSIFNNLLNIVPIYLILLQYIYILKS